MAVLVAVVVVEAGLVALEVVSYEVVGPWKCSPRNQGSSLHLSSLGVATSKYHVDIETNKPETHLSTVNRPDNTRPDKPRNRVQKYNHNLGTNIVRYNPEVEVETPR